MTERSLRWWWLLAQASKHLRDLEALDAGLVFRVLEAMCVYIYTRTSAGLRRRAHDELTSDDCGCGCSEMMKK